MKGREASKISLNLKQKQGSATRSPAILDTIHEDKASADPDSAFFGTSGNTGRSTSTAKRRGLKGMTSDDFEK